MTDFDWAQHAAHRQQVIADRGQWAGLLDENMIPMMDSAPIISLTAPQTRLNPESLVATVRVRSPLGITHPMVDELIAEGLGDVDSQGRLVPVTDATRFFAVQRAGSRQRVYRVRFVIARGGPSGPSTLEIHGSDELSMLQDIPAWSVPTSVTGVWERLPRDWAAEWTRERDLQNLQMAAVADGFSLAGPAEPTLRRLIRESLETSWRAVGILEHPPVVVSQLGSDKDSPDLALRPVDDPLWETISGPAAAAGVHISAWTWWPGDEQPPGHDLELPTIVVEVRHHDADPVVVPVEPPAPPEPRQVSLRAYGQTWSNRPLGGDEDLIAEFRLSGYRQSATFHVDVICDRVVGVGAPSNTVLPGTIIEAGRMVFAPGFFGEATFTEAHPVAGQSSSRTAGPAAQSAAVFAKDLSVAPTQAPQPAPEPLDVVLHADGGEMTVGRQTAVYPYGSWDVVIPEGTEQDTDPRIKDGYIHRPDNAPRGRFDVAFVRADVSMDMNTETSNVEATLDAAEQRVRGDVFFERDIEGRGLGHHVYGEDYRTGDLVKVGIWGKYLPSPVTAADFIDLNKIRVHTGGQLLSDPLALRATNDAVWDAIRAERHRAIQEEQRLAEQAATDRQQTVQIEQQTQRIDTTVGRVDRQQEELVNWAEVLRQTTNSMLEILQVVRGLSWTVRDAGHGIISAGQGDESTAVGIGGSVVENAQNSITALNRLPVPDPIPEIEMEDTNDDS